MVNTASAAALALVFNALVWGLSWWPFQRLHALGLHPLWATALIYGFALVCVLAWRPQAWRVFATHPALWLLALAAGLTNVGFNWAVTVGDVVRVVLLFYLMPAWSIVLAWWLLGERPTRHSLLRLVLALVGVAIMLKTPDSPYPLPHSLADGLALLGGFSFALTNALLRRLRATPDAARAVAMFGGGAALAALVAGLGMTQALVAPPPALAWAWLGLALALALAFLVSNLALQYGAARLAAHVTALIMLSELVFASASSIWLGAAQLNTRTLLGGGLVLLAALWAAWPMREKPGPDRKPHFS